MCSFTRLNLIHEHIAGYIDLKAFRDGLPKFSNIVVCIILVLSCLLLPLYHFSGFLKLNDILYTVPQK